MRPAHLLDPIRPLIRPRKGQSGGLQVIDHSVVRSTRIPSSALQVTAHSQQEASFGGWGGPYPSAELQLVFCWVFFVLRHINHKGSFNAGSVFEVN